MFFASLQELFDFMFSRKPKFKIVDFQISWRHQRQNMKKEIRFTE